MSEEGKDVSDDIVSAAKKTVAGVASQKPKDSSPDSAVNIKPTPKKPAAAKKVAGKKAVAKRATANKTAKGKKRTTTGGRAGGAAPKRTFPVYSLEDCYNLASVIREYNAGNPWSPKEIATALKMGTSSNYFYLTAASRDYGITIGTRDTPKIELTELGRKVVYPKSPTEFAEAMTAAFRNVALFSKVYDYYQGKNLPDIQYLKNTLKTEFGVEERFQDDFYELFQKNLAYLKEKTGELPTAVQGTGKTSSSAGQSDSIILGESSDSGTLVAFVAMPFSEKTSSYPKGYFDEVLKHLITPAAVKANFNARTAKKAGSEVIQSTIVNDLDSADLVIVDLTEHNPNVLFELGMRIAFDKPVCLIRAKGTAPIFDIDHMLRVYDYNPSMWPSTLETDIPALSHHIAETWKKRDADRSYLKILRDNKDA
ncbi:hypothetical protein B0G75_104155 [Paraburkholderia sp. BL18I3N2]|uniref:hypothetical protein n=1 Tax=Paraburkholderia sp. BL18I3N2 TaxID=1938799 RepID=UPI000D4D2FB6|nr:hypothetical protein [Paraburkholderia sp. BL18I3N2]PRX32136.1 hypothetical protein B0G75_104155 [Paraburkholderia sp. BL18I3N2]